MILYDLIFRFDGSSDVKKKCLERIKFYVFHAHAELADRIIDTPWFSRVLNMVVMVVFIYFTSHILYNELSENEFRMII